jgi:hypothetical protein
MSALAASSALVVVMISGRRRREHRDRADPRTPNRVGHVSEADTEAGA